MEPAYLEIIKIQLEANRFGQIFAKPGRKSPRAVNGISFKILISSVLQRLRKSEIVPGWIVGVSYHGLGRFRFTGMFPNINWIRALM